MAFISNQASSSKNSGAGATSRLHQKPRRGKQQKPQIRSNEARRQKLDEEMGELQSRIDSFVRVVSRRCSQDVADDVGGIFIYRAIL